MTKKIEFVNRKEYATSTGRTITMKGVINAYGVVSILCYEDDKLYNPNELVEVIN